MQALIEEIAKKSIQDTIVYMECPFCLHDIAAAWQHMSSSTDELGRPRQQYLPYLSTHLPAKDGAYIAGQSQVSVQWLICQNTDCKHIVVQVNRSVPPEKLGDSVRQEEWIVVPRRKNLPQVDNLVPIPMREDYLEAWTILEDSPRMSSVLSRRVLADLLKQFAGKKQFSLATRIESFIADTQHPSRLRENLHYLREMGDFSAHTQESQTAQNPQVQDPSAATVADQTQTDTKIINVTPEEAQWTLKVVDDLFDYFIVAPEKDKQLRAAFDAKIKAAGRKAIN